MAIEIVGEEPSVKRKASCDNCGAKLEFIPGDIQKSSYTDINDNIYTFCWIDCPRCHRQLQVSEYAR